MKINLTTEHFKYLTNSLLASHPKLVQNITQVSINKNDIDISLDETTADEIRELASEELVFHFDENYTPTKEGKMLELLIDKFFTD